MVCLEVVLETRDLGLKRGWGTSLLHSLLYSANCCFHGISRAPRCGQSDMAEISMGQAGWRDALTQGWEDVGGSAKGGVTDVGWVRQIGEGKDSSWG